MKPGFKILLSLVIVFVLVLAGGLFFLTRGLDAGRGLTINSVDPSLLDDGIYSGEYRAGRWSNKVDVTIKDHRITDIKVVKDVAFPIENIKKGILNRVIENQNTNVDVISGATVTCKAYLKSIENALKR